MLLQCKDCLWPLIWHVAVSIRVAVRDTTELINISRNSTLATVIDVIRNTFNHEARTGWTVFKLKEPLSEEVYFEMRRENLKAITASAKKLEGRTVLRDVLEFPTNDIMFVTLVAEPLGKCPNSMRMETQSLMPMLSRTETDRGTGCLLRKHRSTTRCHPA